jgi:hypothetical protein
MDNIPINKSNLIAQKFWAHTKEIWATLSIGGKQKWLEKAIELTRNAWADLATATDLKCPLTYDDFASKMQWDVNGDGSPETITVHSPAMYYGKLDKKCKNTWDAVAMKQVLEQLNNQYALRDAEIW